MVDKLTKGAFEPVGALPTQEVTMASIAISLKRIADVLEGVCAPLYKTTYVVNTPLEHAADLAPGAYSGFISDVKDTSLFGSVARLADGLEKLPNELYGAVYNAMATAFTEHRQNS